MLLKLENIGKIYDSNDILTVGIRGIDLAFDYNEFVTIEGESGSGKSTLLNVIGANDTYEEGELYFNGEPTSHYSESDWEKYREKNIATIFQDFNIIENLTVLENVELALLRLDDKKERRRRAKELIARVGLTEQMNRRGSKLSGGEKQRTVIARALAKDAPIILADEPTGNLDVKASKEVAALLKEVSRDKLVIVVTHNPEFFKQYATRRVRIYDGSVSEDKQIEPPAPYSGSEQTEQIAVNRFHDIKNILHIGVLNYKSRPKFTLMLSFALLVCAVTLFIGMSLFSQYLIAPITTTLDTQPIEGKVLVSGHGENITEDELDKIAGETRAGYILIDRQLSEFTVPIPKSGGMLSDYTVTCLYAPYRHNLQSDQAVLVIPIWAEQDASAIAEVFLDAGVGIENIAIEKTYSNSNVLLYLAHDTLVNEGSRLRAINSTIMFDDNSATVYSFELNAELSEGQVNLVNSNYYNVMNMQIVFSIASNRIYTVASDTLKNEDVSGLIVQLSSADYESIFAPTESGAQACLYFENNKAAQAALDMMPEGYSGVLSSTAVYVNNAGEVFITDLLWYAVMIAAGVVFALLISMIFMRSVRIYATDFAVYRTLGISSKVSSRSLYVQMVLIFLPTIVLLPIISLIATVIPGSGMAFIGAFEWFFIELILLIIVELVALGFNRSLKGTSIRKSLKRGSK